MMKELGKGCSAVIVVSLAVIFGACGGCWIGGQMPTHSRDEMAGVGLAVNGALIGAGIGLLLGLLATQVARLRTPRGDDSEGRPGDDAGSH